MDKLSQTITVLSIMGLLWLLFGTLEPWIDETFGPSKEIINAKLQAEQDAKFCFPIPVKIINDVSYCDCGKGENQRPGKCK